MISDFYAGKENIKNDSIAHSEFVEKRQVSFIAINNYNVMKNVPFVLTPLNRHYMAAKVY